MICGEGQLSNDVLFFSILDYLKQEASAADLMKFTIMVLHQNANFIRSIQDWELECLSNFIDSIYGTPMKGSGEDKICWIVAKKKGFEVSGYYQVLLNANDQSFPWKSIWKSKIPFRVAFLYGLLPWENFDN